MNALMNGATYELEARGPRWRAERGSLALQDQFPPTNRFDFLADSLTNYRFSSNTLW